MKLLVQKVGGVTRVCSKRCYGAAAGTRCNCICHGRLHGIGEEQAILKVRDLFVGQLGDDLPVVTRSAMRAIRRSAIEEWGDTW